MKLPAHGAGLPGKEVSFILCPLAPRFQGGACGARSGQVVKGSCEVFKLSARAPKLRGTWDPLRDI
jgi:hypothetical protein